MFDIIFPILSIATTPLAIFLVTRRAASATAALPPPAAAPHRPPPPPPPPAAAAAPRLHLSTDPGHPWAMGVETSKAC